MTEFKTKKKFGQNFLKDKNLLDAICEDAGVTKETSVLEIGAGLGTLSESLKEKAKKVVSYEIDIDLVEILKEKEDNVLSFVFKDILDAPLEEVESHFDGEYRIIANIPYYITTPIIFKFLGKSKSLKSMTLMVQKEVAERIVAKPNSKDYGVLSVCCNLYGKTSIKRIVKRNMFHPAPNVDSAIVHIELEDVAVEDGLVEFVRNAFSMRRKTLLNNLSATYGLSKTALAERLKGYDLTRRAETFSIEEYKEIYNDFKKEI